MRNFSQLPVVESRLFPVNGIKRFASTWLTGLHWHTIKEIDHRRLEQQYGEFVVGDVRRLVMDEFALHKGHRYATVVMDAERMKVLWVGEGNSRESLRPFFELLGAERCARIEAVAMNMNTAFDLEVQRHCPQAEVIYDLFHVVARFGREVVDRVRVDQANALRDQPGVRRVIPSSTVYAQIYTFRQSRQPVTPPIPRR